MMLSRASLLRKRLSTTPVLPSRCGWRPGIHSSHIIPNNVTNASGASASSLFSTLGDHRIRGSTNHLNYCHTPIKSAIQSSSITHHQQYQHQQPNNYYHPQNNNHQHQQTRHFAGRKDRHSTSLETRPPTKKQRKSYHARQRKLQYQQTKHSTPNSKAGPRRAEERETQSRLVEIAQEEEGLKSQLGEYYGRVRELQGRIEESDTFQSLVRNGISGGGGAGGRGGIGGGGEGEAEIKAAAREAAMKAAEKEGLKHPPLPSWWQERLTYDWGDALVDDLMGNSSDLTSSPNPYPHFMGKEYGRLRRKVERVLRGMKDQERLLLLEQQGGVGVTGVVNGKKEEGEVTTNFNGTSSAVAASPSTSSSHLPAQSSTPTLSDKLLSDLLRSHRDHLGTRTSPIGLAPSLELVFQELQIPRSSLGTYSYVSLLTCCKSPWEARKVNEMRKEDGVRSNAYFWSALVDVYARNGDYRGAEGVLDEMLEETKTEYELWMALNKNKVNGNNNMQKVEPPITIPPLPAYTSFFSACYKLLSRGDVHPSIKSDASKRAWKRWKEMRIHSVAPDVMAYGALMRVFAAQGRAEKAVDLLDEIMAQLMMPVSTDGLLNGSTSGGGMLQENLLRSLDGDEDGWYDDRDGKTVRVKPTTLLFTSALKSVAKSHEIAVRFSGGKSKNNRRRESIASYHGRLTRKIVILAEQAEVEQDDGFVSALMLCAAAAGDSSTARAIYLGSQVRRMDHLRTCGGKDHLKKLQGLIPKEDQAMMIGQGDSKSLSVGGSGGAGNASSLRTIEEEFKEQHQNYELREYGTDTRILNTLLLAHSKAMESKGLGSMWAGRYNRGYLCDNSLRWIEAYNRPQMENTAIPGISHTEAGLSTEGWETDFDDEDGRSSKQLRKSRKFNIQQIMDDGDQNRKEDLDPFFDGFDDENVEQKNDFLQLHDGNDDVTRDWLKDELIDEKEHPQELLSDGGMNKLEYEPDQTSLVDGDQLSSQGDDSFFGNDFDDDSDDEDDGDFDDDLAMKERGELIKTLADLPNNPELSDEMSDDSDEFGDMDQYFNEEDFEAFLDETSKGADGGGDAQELDAIPGVKSNDFAAFCSHLRAELRKEGSSEGVDVAEARQLFDMMRTYYDEDDSNSNSFPDADFSESDYDSTTFSSSFLKDDEEDMLTDDSKITDFMGSTFDNAAESHGDGPTPLRQIVSDSAAMGMPNKTMYADDYLDWAKSQNAEPSQEVESSNKEASKEVTQLEPPAMGMTFQKESMSPLETEALHITELQEMLPGLPRNRIEKVSDEFSRVLGYPSILRLSLVLRENMPDDLSPQWLTKKNLSNAKHIMSEAEKEGVVDIHLLNGMLQVEANTGRIEPAIRFHDTEFKKHGVTPTTFSDRLLLQMLVKHKRIPRAFKLKEYIENEGRTLDLLSYGSLVEHYGNRKQLGSALLLIKECLDVHGVPPGEKSLKNIRLLCRQKGWTDQTQLEKMIGKDPLEWIREGEQKKRDKKKTGSKLYYAGNRLLDI